MTAIREATGQVDAWLSNKNTWKKAEDTFKQVTDIHVKIA